jgi:GNAT superfamily N-acetyltransferase
MKIEKLEKKEIKNFAEIYYKTFNQKNNDGWKLNQAIKLIKFYEKIQPDLIFVLRENNLIIGGFMGIIRPGPKGNYLVDGELFVDYNNQNKNYGKKLFQYVINYSVKNYNIVQIEAITFSKQKFPLFWYKKIGFKTMDEFLIIEGNPNEILNNL